MTLGSEVDVKVRTKVALFFLFVCGSSSSEPNCLVFFFLGKHFSEKLYDFVFVCYN